MSVLQRYFETSRTPLYGLVTGAMLFALNEGLTLALGTPFRNGAQAWIERLPLFALIDPWILKLTSLLALGVLFIWRKPGVRLRGATLAWMWLEGLCYAVLLAPLVNALMHGLLALAFPEGLGLLEKMALSFGAGLYEELVFRVLLFGGGYWLLRRLSGRPVVSWAVAAAGSASLFSLAHHIGPFGEPFEFTVFAFRVLSGLLFTTLYATRGFGVAALTHALYDVRIVLGGT